MNNRSRIKSDEAYQNIIGSKVYDKDLKVTHDASRYFDELRESKTEEKINPFEKKVSMDDLKTSIQTKATTIDVDYIKEEIAKMQVEESSDDINENVETYEDNQSRRFSFEENARKLYENLRESKSSYYEKEISHLDVIEDNEEGIEVVAPGIIGIQKNENISDINTNKIEENKTNKEIEIDDLDFAVEDNIEEIEFEEIPAIDLSSFEEEIIKENDVRIDEVDLSTDEVVSDFSKENENLLSAIGLELETDPNELELEDEDFEDSNEDLDNIEKELEKIEEDFNLEDILEKEFEDKELEDETIKEAIELDNVESLENIELDLEEDNLDTFYSNDDLLSLINNQEDNEEKQDNDKSDIKEDLFSTMSNENDLLSQISESKGIEEDVNFLSKKPLNESLSDTLTLALNKDESISFSPNELRELKKEDFKDEEIQKRKPLDIILTILLIVMIVVVAYIIFKMITGQ